MALGDLSTQHGKRVKHVPAMQSRLSVSSSQYLQKPFKAERTHLLGDMATNSSAPNLDFTNHPLETWSKQSQAFWLRSGRRYDASLKEPGATEPHKSSSVSRVISDPSPFHPQYLCTMGTRPNICEIVHHIVPTPSNQNESTRFKQCFRHGASRTVFKVRTPAPTSSPRSNSVHLPLRL